MIATNIIRKIRQDEIEAFIKAMSEIPWHREPSIYYNYLQEQQSGLRDFIVAIDGGQYVGHASILWKSQYTHFSKMGIPEISDILVLQKYQRKGIASSLLAFCEQSAKRRKSKIGLGVGLYSDYGPAQILYDKRGYTFDGNGATSHGVAVEAGSNVKVDDDLLLWLVKDL